MAMQPSTINGRRLPFPLLILSMLPGTASAAYLGLRNQGNTCYMNSLLQTLHHLPEFRRAIYSIPTNNGGNESSAIDAVSLELQRVFYELQFAEVYGKAEVGTEGLTKSFGWGRREVNVQQDVQEFARMLCDALQSGMKSHGVADGIAELFEGRTAAVTRCTRVPFEKEKEERFYDLQLQVQGCGDLHSSLRHFVREERLSGDNKWNTQDPKLGKQEARRATRFKRLPPILHLHLKRFEYDVNTGGMEKLQQAFAFPTVLKLHRYMAKNSHGPGDPPPVYQLQAVLSHVGNAGGGHYVAYVKPRGSSQWFEFDDTRVTPVSEEVAVRQQYGGKHGKSGGGFLGFGAKPNAYMLVYVRRDLFESESSDGGADDPSSELLPAGVRESFEKALHGGRRHSRGRGAVRASPVGREAAKDPRASAALEEDDFRFDAEEEEPLL